MHETDVNAAPEAALPEEPEINNGYNLFRAEAVDYRFRRLTGRVSLESTQHIGVTATMGSLFILAVTLIFTQVKVPVYTRMTQAQAMDTLRSHTAPVKIMVRTGDGQMIHIPHAKALDEVRLRSDSTLYEEDHRSLAAAIFSNKKDAQ
jgi:hypothetical protein